MVAVGNEIGTGAARGRPTLSKSHAERGLSDAVGHAVELPDNTVIHGSPAECRACGSDQVEWGCSDYRQRTKDEIHPLLWDDEAWMADSFVRRACDAGWIEPDDPEPTTWARPYWLVDATEPVS